MDHYYILNTNARRGFVEVTEDVFNGVMGDETTTPYARKVYRGEMRIEDVPEEIRETVQAVVAAKVEYFGEYKKQSIRDAELAAMLEGVL